MKMMPSLTETPEALLSKAYELQEGIKKLVQTQNDWQEELDLIKEKLMAHGITEAGNYAMEQKVSVRREINAALFREMFPQEFNFIRAEQINKAEKQAGSFIHIKDAERYLGTDKIDPICDLKTTVKMVVVKTSLE